MTKVDISNLSTDQREMLNGIIEEMRKPYTDFIERLSVRFANDLDWNVSSIVSRDIHLSPLFLNCCYLELIKRLVQEEDGPLHVIVSSSALARIAKTFFSASKKVVAVSCRRTLRKIAQDIFCPIHSFFTLFLFENVKKQLFYRVCGCRQRPRRIFDRPVTLLDTFIIEESFKDGRYNDRYYPMLHDFLSDEEKKDFYYLPQLAVRDYRRIFNEIKSSREQFLLKEDFLTAADYFFAAFHPVRKMRFKFLPGETVFLGLDLAPLIREEMYVNLCNPNSMGAVLNYAFVKRLKENAVKVRLVIDWYENQVLDRGLVMAFRISYKDLLVIGYQGFILSPSHYIHTRPTGSDRRYLIAPQEIAVVGRELVRPVKEFCADLTVVTAPAFRFGSVWRKRKAFPDHLYTTFFTPLPGKIDAGNDILILLTEVAKMAEFKECRFWLKVHPTHTRQAVLKHFPGGLGRQFTFVDGSFESLIEQADLMIGNSSSTCLEALARGIPVIIIGSRLGITNNPIPSRIPQDLWTICYTPEELARAIIRFSDRDDAAVSKHNKMGEQIRADYFEPVTSEATRRFLKLPKEIDETIS